MHTDMANLACGMNYELPDKLSNKKRVLSCNSEIAFKILPIKMGKVNE